MKFKVGDILDMRWEVVGIDDGTYLLAPFKDNGPIESFPKKTVESMCRRSVHKDVYNSPLYKALNEDD